MKDENIDLETFCIHCMQRKSNHHACPACGHHEHHYIPHPLYLKPYTLLQNQYIIGKALGQGGFGITYIGFDKWLEKKVAIKEFLPSALATRDFQTDHIVPLKKQENAFYQGLELFINEARNLAKFDHPNIVRVINFFEENQTAYMVMEHLEGENLTELLNRTGCCLTVEESLAIILPILDALAEVHAQHIYHRDISPQNVRLLPSGIPILIDFGAARHVVGENSRSLDLVLKHGYSPLEQYSGKGKIGAWTDIYACGALLYLLISGKLPSAATDRFCDDALQPLITLPNVSISQVINDAIMTALAVRSEERFQTVQDFKAALEGRQSVILQISPNRIKSTRYPVMATVLAVVVTLTISIIILLNFVKPPILPLLEQAKMQWANNQITTSIDNNAHETYQRILAIDPYNFEAKQGIENIATYYVQQAKQAQISGEIAQGLQFVAQGLQVIKSHKELQNLQRSLQTQQIQQQLQISQVNKLLTNATRYLTDSQLEAAYHTYQQVLSLNADNQAALDGLKQVETQYIQQINQQHDDFLQRMTLLNQALAFFPNSKIFVELQQTTPATTTQTTALTAQDEIPKLLNKAEQQLKALQLTEPVGNNAYETYQQILAIVPNQPKAISGITKIADLYEKLATNDSVNIEKNLALIDKGLKVLPQHAGLSALRQKLIEKQTQPIKLPTKPEETMVIVEPVVPQKNELVEKIALLLTTAKQKINNQQFEAAYYLYTNVLQLETNNQSAQQGLQQIAQHYEQLAKQQKAAKDFTTSLATISKGLALYPKHDGLLQLQQEIRNNLVTTHESETTQTIPNSHNILFTPSF